MAVIAPPEAVLRARRLPSPSRVVCALPDLVACGFAGFALPAIVALLAGHFSPGWVLPFGIAGAVTAMAVCGLGDELVDRRTAIYTLAAIGLVLAWLIVNSFFSAENIFAHRDPATYNLAGRWLMDHSRMPVPTHPQIFGSPGGFDAPGGYDDASPGFGRSGPGELYAQGNHLLPALLAAAGWLFGTTGLLKANVVFGAAALLVFFGLARRVVPAPMALLAMAAFAVSMPMIFVSRDTYSEPLALLFVVGGLGLMCRAAGSGRIRDYALAGLVIAMAAPVRIDSNVSLLAVVVAAGVVLAFAAPGARRDTLARVGALLGAMALPTLLGWLDVARLAYGYYRDERHRILQVFDAGAAVIVLMAILVALAWHPAVRRVLGSPRLARYAIVTAGVLIFSMFALLISRPLWTTGHSVISNGLVAHMQQELGEPQDATRTYSEQTVHWLAMYLGWPTVALGVTGYFLLIRRAIRTRTLELAGLLTVGLAMTLLYLASGQITPDQPWAMRRYVPVVMPLLLVAATYVLCVLRRRPAAWLRVAGSSAALLLLAFPVYVTAPVADVREEVPQLAQVQRICSAVHPNGAVLIVDRASTSYLQTIRSYCNVPSIGLYQTDTAQLAEVRQSVADHGRVLYLLAADATAIDFAGPAPSTPYSQVRTTRWPSTLHKAPTKADHETVQVYLATVRPDGLAVPVSAAG